MSQFDLKLLVSLIYGFAGVVELLLSQSHWIFSMFSLAIPQSLNGWVVMWTISVLLYVILKLLSWCSARRADAPLWKHWAYLLAWPGMDAEAFLFKSLDGKVSSARVSEWCFAFAKFASGLLLVFAFIPTIGIGSPFFVGWLGIVAMILSLHMGLIHLLSCWWRSCGAYAAPIMNWPILATGLADFWGQRWNLAFRDLTHRFVFRPLAKRHGMKTALVVAFVLSGLIHDLAISIPAQGGYGLPSLYFCLQGLGVLFEKSRLGKRIGLGSGLHGRCFAMLCLLAPIQLLFHRNFVVGVFYPFLQFLGVTP